MDVLASVCRDVRFAPGEVLRRKGEHYRDMYWITDGQLEVDLGAGAAPLARQAGSPVGEIAFLRGWPATATVTARTPVRALVIDDPTLARLEREEPAAAAGLMRQLAASAEERTSHNVAFEARLGRQDAGPVEVQLCRTPEMLEGAQR